MKKILCLFAHPDDAEIWVGGTLLKHIEANYKVKVITFFEHTKIRLKEVKKSSEVIGYEHIILNTEDYTIPDYENIISLIGNDIPDIVFTHWNEDTHLEHQHIYKLTENTIHYWKRHNKKIPLVLMVSTYFMKGRENIFNPDVIVDIEDYLLRKEEAIKCHESQKVYNLLNDINSQQKIFAGQAGINIAEGFKEKVFFGKKKLLVRDFLVY